MPTETPTAAPTSSTTPQSSRDQMRELLLKVGMSDRDQLSRKKLRRLREQLGRELSQRHFTQVPFNKVTAQPVQWLWPGRIALGKINLIQGDAGVGKSRVALDLAARVSAGLAWPDDAGPAPRGQVLLMCCDDGIADTVHPQVEAAGGDRENVVALGAVARDVDGRWGPHDLDAAQPHDVESALKDWPKAKLVVIDPAAAFHAAGGNGAKARQWLKGMATLAAKYNVAFVLVAPKTPSKAMLAIARTAWLIERHPQQSDRRLMSLAKNNLAAESDGLALRLGDGPIAWEPADSSEAAPTHRRCPRKTGPAPQRRTTAMAWLSECLAQSPRPVIGIRREAEAAGLSWATVRRASETMPIISERDPDNLCYVWRLREERIEAAVTGSETPRPLQSRGIPRTPRNIAPRPRNVPTFERTTPDASSSEELVEPLAASRLDESFTREPASGTAETCATCATSQIPQEIAVHTAAELCEQPAQPEQASRLSRLSAAISRAFLVIVLCVLPMIAATAGTARAASVVGETIEPAQPEQGAGAAGSYDRANASAIDPDRIAQGQHRQRRVPSRPAFPSVLRSKMEAMAGNLDPPKNS